MEEIDVVGVLDVAQELELQGQEPSSLAPPAGWVDPELATVAQQLAPSNPVFNSPHLVDSAQSEDLEEVRELDWLSISQEGRSSVPCLAGVHLGRF